jgi:NTE family protein
MRRLERVDLPLLEGLEPAALEEVYWRLRPRHFGAGQVICRAGDPGDRLFVIRHGLVYVLGAEPAGDAPPMVVARHRPGEVVGELALLSGAPQPATLVAHLPTDAFELSRATFLSLAARFPILMTNLAGILSRRLGGQAGVSGRARRAGAVAVVPGQVAMAHLAELLAATRAASPGPLEVIDLGTSRQDAQAASEALARVEACVRDGGNVLTVVGPDHRHLRLVLDYMDRVVAIMDPHEAARLAGRLDKLTERVELAQIGAVDAYAGPGQVIRRWPGDLGAADLAWLGRHLAGTKLGLALGAGGAKGYAHVGVIRVLQRAGYTIDFLAGSSIGAWVAAWLALGMDADEIERTLRAQFTADVVEAVFRRGSAGDPSGPQVMARVARVTTGDRTFEALGVPLVVMATDLEGRQSVATTSGPVHAALVAAMAVPGLYSPIQDGQRRLVDAVVTMPVPSEALIGTRADVTVAVNLLGRETLPTWPGEDPPDPRARPAARDTVVEALEVAQIDVAARQTALADVPITPRFGPGTWRYFHLADRYLAAGAEAAEAALPRLAALARPHKEIP